MRRLGWIALGVALVLGWLPFESVAPAQTTADRVDALEQRFERIDERTLQQARAAGATNQRVSKLETRKTPSFWIGLASGSILALLGVLVKWAVDAFREHRERKTRDTTMIEICGAELTGLREAAEENQQVIQTELSALRATGKTVVAPLRPLALPSFQQLWADPPKGLERRWEVLTDLSRLVATVEHANDLGRRRDTYLASDGTHAAHLQSIDEKLDAQLSGVMSDVALLNGRVGPRS